jgi:hypothetical protein
LGRILSSVQKAVAFKHFQELIDVRLSLPGPDVVFRLQSLDKLGCPSAIREGAKNDGSASVGGEVGRRLKVKRD